jgi:hypothetical protein
MNFTGLVKRIQTSANRHSPEILTGIGIAGMLTTVILAVRVTPKAVRRIEQAETEKSLQLGLGSESIDGVLTPVETIRVTWKYYIPAVITGGMSIACLIGANAVNTRRNAALATAFAFSESTLREYRAKVIDTIGEKKEQTVRDAIAKDQVDRNPVSNREIYITEKGGSLCLDTVSGRYFKSDIETIRKAINNVNFQMLREMSVTLNDFYYELGLANTKQGYDLGWHVDDGRIEVSFSSQIADDGTPCLVLDYRVAPKYDYKR